MNKKLSLHIATNYKGTSSELNGCIHDALDWQRECASRGYTSQTLLEHEATRDNTLAALTDHVGDTGWGDRLVITYSGHGSWVPDTSGDEDDQRDEVLVMHDYRARGYITDDQLHDVFSKKRFGAHIFFVSDSCHSGTLTRAMPLTDTGPKPRFMSPALLLADQPALLGIARTVENVPARGVSRTGPLLLSGCADDEYSYDALINGRFNGAMTRTALDTLNSVYNATGSYASWYREIRRRLPSGEYPQSPALVGTAWQKRRAPLS